MSVPTPSPHPTIAELMDSSFDGLSVHDVERRVRFANRSLATLLGRDPDDLVGHDACDYAHPDDAHELQGAFREVLADRRQQVVSYRVLDAASAALPVETVVLNFVDDPLIRGIVLRTRPYERSMGSCAHRVAELEQRLRRIAQEIESSGVVRAPKALPNPAAMSALDGLSTRQLEVAARLLRGERVTTIAREMFLSASTVRNHLTTVFRKVGVHSQAELIERMRAGDGSTLGDQQQK